MNHSREKCIRALLGRFSDVLSYVLDKSAISSWDCCIACDGARSDRMIQVLRELGIRYVEEQKGELFCGYSLALVSLYMEETFERPQSCEHALQGLSDYSMSLAEAVN
jgi:hypothetical protein